MIGYTGKSASSGTAQLTGLSRAVSLSMFTGGTTRTFTGGTAATHSTGTGVILISQSATPTISHWGSAFLTDGGFDQDRGYIFNYQAPNIIAGPVKKTAFAIRLAPSVSNAIPGDLGVRELINRAQLLLQSIEITAGGGTSPNQAIIIEGVLNPSNYSTSTNNTTWNSLQGGPQGGNAYGTGQPSFAQIAPGNTMFFDNSTTYITTVAAGAAAGASTIAVYTTATMQVGDAISTASGTIAGGTVITNCSSSATVQISQPLIGNLTANVGIAGFRNTYAQPGETIFSFISSPANKDALDLSALKEMTNTPLGGRGAYPNGPDVLAINVYVTTGTALSTNLVLRWGEAQA